MIKKVCNLFVAMLVLLIATEAGALPAVVNSSSLPAFAASHNTAAQIPSSPDSVKSLELSDLMLIEIGKELSGPPVATANSTKLPQLGVRPLPAVPATFVMVLSGFLCVSLIKDRKVWLKVVFGALNLGAAGVNIVPQLLAEGVAMTTKQLNSDKDTSYKAGDSISLIGAAQGTRYVGLLHRMAISDGDSLAGNHGGELLAAHWYNSGVLLVSFLRSASSSQYSYLLTVIKSHIAQFSLRNLFAVVCNCHYPSPVSVTVSNSYFSLNHLAEANLFYSRMCAESVYVSAPVAVLLGGIDIGFVKWMKKRRGL